jgi:hypothetical protein
MPQTMVITLGRDGRKYSDCSFCIVFADQAGLLHFLFQQNLAAAH